MNEMSSELLIIVNLVAYLGWNLVCVGPQHCVTDRRATDIAGVCDEEWSLGQMRSRPVSRACMLPTAVREEERRRWMREKSARDVAGSTARPITPTEGFLSESVAGQATPKECEREFVRPAGSMK